MNFWFVSISVTLSGSTRWMLGTNLSESALASGSYIGMSNSG
jgi:hypothetical protein